MHRVPRVTAPSDPIPKPPFTLGGRVLEWQGAQGVVGDAFDELPVSFLQLQTLPFGTGTTPEDMALRVRPVIGDLVEIDVTALGHDGRLVASALRVVGRDARRETGATEQPALRERGRLALLRRGHNLRRRSELMGVVRRFFDARRYLEVETPLLVPSPGMDVHLDAFPVVGLEGAPPRYLATSPEYQMKRLLAAGVPRLFQLGKCFRRGEVGARHNPEFTMLEWYRAFGTFEEMIDETEALIVEVATAARGTAELVVPRPFASMSYSNEGPRVVPLDPPFERLPILEAFERHATASRIGRQEALDLALSARPEDEERFFRVLVEEVEPALAEGPPVVLVDYPVTQASLARKRDADPRLAERFEVFVGGIELCNGFGELVDPVEQRARFAVDQKARAARGVEVYPIDERFLDALDEGVPPSAGNALGVDRLVALALGAAEIGDVLAFPEAWL